MNRTQIPPQAYTRDTLEKAYEWLNHQSPAIKDQAQTADTLVSLFLRAQRYGETSLGNFSKASVGTVQQAAPASVQLFQSDLKNLAKDFEEFDDINTLTPPIEAKDIAPLPSPHVAPPAKSIKTRVTQSMIEFDSEATALDPKSLKAAEQIQKQFNLSSPTEAIRMLISVGYKQIQKLLLLNDKEL